MSRKLLWAGALGLSSLLGAAEAAGSVAAAEGLQLNGQDVPVAGTRQWPLAAGDELQSKEAPLVLTMKDGSRVVLGKQSRAKVEAGVVRLLAGTMQYALAPKSGLQVAVKSDVLAARTGLVATSGRPVAPVVSAPALELQNVSPSKPRRGRF